MPGIRRCLEACQSLLNRCQFILVNVEQIATLAALADGIIPPDETELLISGPRGVDIPADERETMRLLWEQLPMLTKIFRFRDFEYHDPSRLARLSGLHFRAGRPECHIDRVTGREPGIFRRVV